ncbi:hypothetical protein Acr_00g0004090 [Actinidia rufa]|uniref:Uncharacterized protein n=1 Tax=Actinidia rufa TaxID=165716 RepID=A0A7J0D6G5_9ERIC|nr:hypothetical protein Acr_00g0000130 [Actinidia rufa]GFS28161.1 hypothetical protein Acr_00g0000300 [Actinidia rufa]GFS28288.1 hypothetical protein Acr_00g0000990 [Actinidia rufa]GFS28298.1 hypothetical protein Acr_00g0001040 [Actinidia rufa]GFS28821.1 hypothetical protein Acr_00g0004090 [Actinidia rufa]
MNTPRSLNRRPVGLASISVYLIRNLSSSGSVTFPIPNQSSFCSCRPVESDNRKNEWRRTERNIGALEFAKKFRIHDRDLTPVGIKMLRSARYSIAWMPICRSVNVSSLRVSMRLRGGIIPMPLRVWLGFPEGFLVSPYQMGMVRQMQLESCSPEWSYVSRLVDDSDRQLVEDALLLPEKLELRYGVRSMSEYAAWWCRAETDLLTSRIGSAISRRFA